MRKFAHIINPVLVGESSDLFKAQPITFRTMQTAREFAGSEIEIELFTAQYTEDRKIIPTDYTMTPDLERSVLDFVKFEKKRKLPLLKDILDRLFEATDAEYLIYTNVDIALQPHFYLAVNSIVEEGVDSFIINRRTISDKYQEIEQIPLMSAQTGKKHPGRDCFIFKRQFYPHYNLGNVCIGTGKVGAVLTLNLIYNSIFFQEFRDLHLTFHIGEQRTWREHKFQDYYLHNKREWEIILNYFRKRSPNTTHELIDRMTRSDNEKGFGICKK